MHNQINTLNRIGVITLENKAMKQETHGSKPKKKLKQETKLSLLCWKRKTDDVCSLRKRNRPWPMGGGDGE